MVRQRRPSGSILYGYRTVGGPTPTTSLKRSAWSTAVRAVSWSNSPESIHATLPRQPKPWSLETRRSCVETSWCERSQRCCQKAPNRRNDIMILRNDKTISQHYASISPPSMRDMRVFLKSHDRQVSSSWPK